MNAQAQSESYSEVPLFALSDDAPDTPVAAFVPDELPPESARRPDIIPCTFHGKGLSIEQWVVGKGFYDAACAWRLEMGGEFPTVRFNRRVLAGFLRAYRGVPPQRRIERYAKKAARAGIERAVAILTGQVIKLRQRPKPLKMPADDGEPVGDGTLLLFR